MSNVKNAADIVNALIKEIRIQKFSDYPKFVNFWARILGQEISSKTKIIALQDGVLFVSTPAATIKTQIENMKLNLLKKLREEFPQKIIKDIKVNIKATISP